MGEEVPGLLRPKEMLNESGGITPSIDSWKKGQAEKFGGVAPLHPGGAGIAKRATVRRSSFEFSRPKTIRFFPGRAKTWR